jgi:hypothetical protein
VPPRCRSISYQTPIASIAISIQNQELAQTANQVGCIVPGRNEDSLDLAKLIEAFAKLADSLEKMGPLAMSLFASMFFMVLALLAAGFGK